MQPPTQGAGIFLQRGDFRPPLLRLLK